jgi:MYXO-CTERM domain-containing protein
VTRLDGGDDAGELLLLGLVGLGVAVGRRREEEVER